MFKTCIITTDTYLKHDTGPGHPERPDRVSVIIDHLKKINPKLLCFTPGIRLEVSSDDQKRTMTPREALNEGSDYLILGRPLTSGDPTENIKKIKA